ncbi:MAG: hypothetical protein M1269_13180 [Chloroflexi bacterium]|nr:hypothetical protein [Chloroflexota bacterium]
MEEKKKLVEEKVREKAVDGRLSCRSAFGIAEELDVNPRMVGDAANELKVKIFACQLGCFK